MGWTDMARPRDCCTIPRFLHDKTGKWASRPHDTRQKPFGHSSPPDDDVLVMARRSRHGHLIMPFPHIALAILVTLVWGYNFVAIRAGLDLYPPLLFSGLRFAAASLPFLPFVGGPGIGWRWILSIGVILGVLYFALLFVGMAMGMPAGVCSALVQTQAFFTMGFAALMLGERPHTRNICGTIIAFAGVVLIAGGVGLGNVLAFLMVMGSAICWGYSNILTRRANAPDALKLMVWVSAVATVPLLLLSWLVEGRQRIVSSLLATTWTGIGAIAYVAVGATIVGFGLWSYLLKRHPTGTVAPFSLLVPVFGLTCCTLFLGERPNAAQVGGVALILAGLAVSSWRLENRARR